MVAQDIATGFMSTSRFIVTFAGCLSLLGIAFVISHEGTRTRVAESLPVLVAGLTAAADFGEQTVGDDAAAAAVVDATRPQFEFALEQRNISQYLSRRYRVAEEAVRHLVREAYEAGRELDLDPTLILAVMAIESSMNPFAESSVGAQGLMQVLTRVHTDKFEPHGGEHAALDPTANIRVGSAILKDLIRRGGSVERGLQLYVGAGNLPDDGGYGSRVLAERSRIQIASSGRVQVALNAALRSDSARAETRSTQATPAT